MIEVLHGMIAGLHCPYCGSGLAIERVLPDVEEVRGNAVLRCQCYRYPVLDGIPILRQQSPVGTNVDPVVALMDSGDLLGALRAAMGVAPYGKHTPKAWIRSWLARKWPAREHPARVQPDMIAHADFQSALRALKPAPFADYLYYRHSNQSFMAATVLACSLRELHLAKSKDDRRSVRTKVLDVGCGVGHTTFLLTALFPNLDVVAVDLDFACLRIARRFVAPNGVFICLDAESPLPFSGDEFSACLVLDGLHYVRAKVTLLKELDRVLQRDAIWLFPHMHNALQGNIAPGVPLPPAGWARLLAFLPHRFLPEAEIISGFAERDACDLGFRVSDDHLEASPALAAVATRRDRFFRSHERLSDVIIGARAALALNPVLRAERVGNGVKMTARWPSQELRDECMLARAVLPESMTLVAADLARLGLRGGDVVDVQYQRQLIRRFALVPLPPGYPRAAAEHGS